MSQLVSQVKTTRMPFAIASLTNIEPHPPEPLAFKRCSFLPTQLPNYESAVVNNSHFNEESPRVFGVEGTLADVTCNVH